MPITCMFRVTQDVELLVAILAFEGSGIEGGIFSLVEFD